MRVLFFLMMMISSFLVRSQSDVDAIKKVADAFSANFVNGNYKGMHDAYWDDASLLPFNRDILTGKEAIVNFWSFGENFRQLYHRCIAEKIEVVGNTAYDYGYWYAESERGDRKNPLASGKYMIVWQKRNGVWKMYLDIWNNRDTNWIPKRPD